MEFNRIKAILQDYAYTNEKDWDEFKQLNRLSRIGAAIEKVVENAEEHMSFDNIEHLVELAEEKYEL